jgi:hypothetical protein
MSALDNRSFVQKATDAFRSAPPDWVLALAEYVDQPGVRLKGASGALGYSTAVISTVIVGAYKGDVARVEEKVRGLLMGLTVDCPVLDEISRNTCLDWQKKPRAQTSSLRARMYRACRSCPHFRHSNAPTEEGSDADRQ